MHAGNIGWAVQFLVKRTIVSFKWLLKARDGNSLWCAKKNGTSGSGTRPSYFILSIFFLTKMFLFTDYSSSAAAERIKKKMRTARSKREQWRDIMGMAYGICSNIPTNIGTTRTTPTATPLVVISDVTLVTAGCAKGSLFSTILTPALPLGQPITKCTLAILVGM